MFKKLTGAALTIAIIIAAYFAVDVTFNSNPQPQQAIATTKINLEASYTSPDQPTPFETEYAICESKPWYKEFKCGFDLGMKQRNNPELYAN